MDEFLNACSAWPPGVRTENPPANQVAWPAALLLAWLYTKLPLFSIQRHYGSSEYGKEIAKQKGSWEKADLPNPPSPLLLVSKESWHAAVPTPDISLRPPSLAGISVLYNRAMISLTSGLGFTGTASSALFLKERKNLPNVGITNNS